MTVPPLIQGLFEDAAVVSSEPKPLPDAVSAHVALRRSAYRDAVGPLIVPADRLAELPPLVRRYAEGTLEVSVAVRGLERLPAAVDQIFDTPGLRLAALEVTGAADNTDEVIEALDSITANLPSINVYVTIPHDRLRTPWLRVLHGSPYRAAFRADTPDDASHLHGAELAVAITDAVRQGVPFKVIPGVLEPGGVLHLLAATQAAHLGRDPEAVQPDLITWDERELRERLCSLDAREVACVRNSLVSVGTNSVTESIDALIGVGLLKPPANS